MGDAVRFSLVLASQCEAMGEGFRLAGLEEAARELDAVLLDPLRGSCASALESGRSLLLNPDRALAYAAVWEAAERAAAAGGMLVLAWVGHGMEVNGDFYVLPQGCVPIPGHPYGPYQLTQHIRELLGRLPGLELLVLVDACASGDAAVHAAAGWTRLNSDARRHFQVLTAANPGEPAWGCVFTRATTGLLRGGDIRAGDRLNAIHLKRAAERASGDQQPVLVSWDGASGPDQRGMWVARNAALLREAGSLPAFLGSDLPQLQANLSYYRPTPALAQLVRATQAHPYVVVRGAAGYGKTTLLEALSRPEVSAGVVPEGFVHGLRLLKLHESAERVAGDLAAQLAVTTTGFHKATQAFRQSVPKARWEVLSQAERVLLGPLRLLPAGTTVRVVLDGFDQLSDTASAGLGGLIDDLRGLPQQGAQVHMVVSSRPGAVPPPADTEIIVDAASDADLHAYLASQDIPTALLDTLTAAAQGSWLVAYLLAGHAHATPGLTPEQVPHGLAAVYDRIFDDALGGGATWDQPASPERALFTVLAAAGPGAVLPTELLTDACARLGTPQVSAAWLRDQLPSQLRRLTVRAAAGEGQAATWLYGLFHQTLVDHLVRPSAERSAYTVDAVDGHRVIAEAIAVLAPAAARTTGTQPLQEYADRAEPDHLWRSGAYAQALDSLEARSSVVPADNVDRWRHWYDEALRQLGPDHPDTLNVRGNIAYWTGGAGDPARALELFTALLPDQVRVLGPNHPGILATRDNISYLTGRAGDPARALELLVALLPDLERMLGPDHPHTFAARGNIAYWRGEAGDAARALEVFTALLPDQERVLGPSHRDTLAARGNIARWTGRAGDPARALELFTALLVDHVRVLGANHPDTLTTRANIARWTGEAGDPARALEVLTALLPDRVRVLGPNHPDTLATRDQIAYWTGRVGDAARALEFWTELLPVWLTTFGADHPRTRRLYEQIAEIERDDKPSEPA